MSESSGGEGDSKGSDLEGGRRHDSPKKDRRNGMSFGSKGGRSPWHRREPDPFTPPSELSGYFAGEDIEERFTSGPFEEKYDRPSVLLIYTGGTLGMKKDKAGQLVPVTGYFTDQMLHMEDIASSEEFPSFDIIEYDPLLDSSCFSPADWGRIAVDIGQGYHDYDGFVVCMGTDTMAYAASALSFMLENLGKTVVFTGSQIPLSEVYNDARRNVIVAMIMAANEDIPEVCLFFGDRLLRANRACKVDSAALQAFDSPNFPNLAKLGVNMKYRRDLVLPPPQRPFRVHTKMDSRIVVLKLIPGFDDDALMAVVDKCSSLHAIVLELYGTGNSPNRRKGFLECIQTAMTKGIVVVAVTQCVKGGVNLTTYAVGAALVGMGVVSGGDMTTEAVVTKLAYLFGRLNGKEKPLTHYGQEKPNDLDLLPSGISSIVFKTVVELMTKDLRGELSPRRFVHPIFSGSRQRMIVQEEESFHVTEPRPRL